MAQFKKPSKKATIITAAIIVILLIIAATGTVVFLKDRGSTEAAEIGQEEVSTQSENSDSQTQTGEQSSEEQTASEETTTGEVATQGEEGTEAAQGTTQTGTQGTTTGTTTGGTTTTTTEGIQESTITRTETVETVTPWENQILGWTPSGVNADFASAGLSTLNVQEDDVKIEKEAYTKTGEGLAQVGEVIEYKITVMNNSEKAVEVKDRIPEQTTYVSASADNGAEEVKEDDGTVTGLVWNVEAGKTIVLSFKVTVNAGATGVISNVAVANGEESDPTETAIVEITKTSEVKSGDTVLEGEDKVAKEGDFITYTVSVKNTGNEKATVNVKDVKLSELIAKGILEVEEASKATADKLMAGTDVTVPAGETVELTFTTKVLKVDGAITNIVTAGDNDTTEPEDPITTDTVETKGLLVEKTVDDTPEVGEAYRFDETVTFKVTVTNTGSTTLNNIDVTDTLKDAKLTDGTVPIKELDSGKSVTLTYEYKVQESDVEKGSFVNGVTAKTDDGVTGEDETDPIPVEQNYSYTVEYYYDGKIDNSKTETETAKFKDVIENYQDKNITGYKLDRTENLPLTISGNEADNVIKVFYVKDTFEYTVEYYYDGKIDDKKTETETATYQDVIENYEDKNITGYKLEKTENLPLTVSEKAESNVIKVFYVKDEFKYTVEYYYDGKIDDKKTETYTATYQDVINNYEDKNITGYKLDRTENLPLTVSEKAENNVIKVYYVKDEFKYTVEYYYDGTIDDKKTETYTATYQDVIDNYEDKNITGYKLEKTENLPLTVSEKAENNVIKVFYVKDEFKYTVEYYYDGTIDDKKTETYTATFNDVIRDYEDKNITGYKLDRTENLPLTVSEKAENNVIKVYYVKDEFKYTVEYYYDGQLNEENTETYTATFNDVIRDYEDKNITGYKLEKTENLPLTVSENSENNVIKVYYVKDEFKYTVEYYYDGQLNEENTETYTATFNDVIRDYEDKNITGYKLEKTENLPLTVSENPENNVIKVFYVKDEFKYTVEYYYDGQLNEENTETYTATFNDVIRDYEDKNITGYKLEKTENLPLTVSENPENNVIKVFYVKDEFKYTVEYYYDGQLNEENTETYTATFNDVIRDYEDKNITGYKLEKTENLPLTVSENPENNVIKVFYVKDEFKYTVEYYYDGQLNEENTETYTATFNDVIRDYEDKNITGYKLEKTENLPLTVSENPENNVIKVYYVKDEFKYTVEYYYDGTIDNKATETKAAVYGTEISTYTDKVKTGYKLEKTENLPLTVSENPENNVIKVYYVKDEFKYTVEYYYNGEKDNSKTETETAVYGTEIKTYTDKVIEGYKFDRVENLPLIVSENPANNVIKVYYVAKPEPSLQLTKTAMKNGREIENIVYNPDSNSNTFTYRLTVENTVQDSYPAVITDTQTVTDILPEGITVSGSLPAGVSQETVNVDGVNRQKLTWTVNNIGYGDAAKSVDITVNVDEKVFKNVREDAGEETTVLDVQFSYNSSWEKDEHINDRTGKVMNLFLRTAGATNKNDGYIYAGHINANPDAISGSTFASDTYYNDSKVNEALKDEAELEDMLDDFVEANQNGRMAQYVENGVLPDRDDINRVLSQLYGDSVKLSPTQVVLWYKVVDNADSQRQRYYTVRDDDKIEPLFKGYVPLEACTYHLDGIIVDVSDLGTIIPEGAQVDVTNTAEVNDLTASAEVSIHYKEQKSTYSMNLLSTIINDEELSEEKADEIAAKADELDKANSVVASEEKDDEATAVEKEENTASDNNSSQETTDSTDKEESKPEEEKTTTPTPPAKEESTEQDDITSSDDKNKNESAVESVEQQTLDSQEE